MVHVFRLRRSNFRLGLSTLIALISMAVLTGISDYLDDSGQPRLWPILLIWLLFIMLAGWLILEYHRSRLLVGAKSLLLRGAVRSKRTKFKDIVHAKWQTSSLLRVQTTSGNLTIPVSQFPTNQHERIMGLLHERFAPDVEEGWAEIERSLESKRKDASPKHPMHCQLRLLRLLLLGPIFGALAGTIMHFMYGYHPELGWQASLVLVGTGAGCMGSILLLVLLGWQIWVEWPEP